jgi:hypothetical protein
MSYAFMWFWNMYSFVVTCIIVDKRQDLGYGGGQECGGAIYTRVPAQALVLFLPNNVVAGFLSCIYNKTLISVHVMTSYLYCVSLL